MEAENTISIWFFVGLTLAVNGALVLAAGVRGLFQPPAHAVVLSGLHAGIWWGAILLGVGLFYFFWFYPRAGSGSKK